MKKSIIFVLVALFLFSFVVAQQKIGVVDIETSMGLLIEGVADIFNWLNFPFDPIFDYLISY